MTAVLWRLVNFLQAALIGLWSLLWIPLALVARLVTFSPALPLAMARKIWAPGILALSGARLEVRGVENLEPGRSYLFAVNHQSQLDIPVVFQGLPMNLRFLVKDELRRIPLLSWYISAMGMVYIDRKDRPRALRHMEKMTASLQEGACFVTYPEGSRSRDGEIRRFKSGALVPALEAQVPVVPVALEGVDRVLPPGTLAFRPGRIQLAIGMPIAADGLTPLDRRSFARRVETQVRALYDGLRHRAGTFPGTDSP